MENVVNPGYVCTVWRSTLGVQRTGSTEQREGYERAKFNGDYVINLCSSIFPTRDHVPKHSSSSATWCESNGESLPTALVSCSSAIRRHQCRGAGNGRNEHSPTRVLETLDLARVMERGLKQR